MTEKEEEKTEINETEVLDKRFQHDPEAKYRIYSVISYFIILVVIGIPVWWYTTRVYRASLPIDEMFNVEIPSKTIRENSIPLSLEYDVLITIVNPHPENLKLDLNAKDLNINLQPFLKTIAPIANFTVKSQWLYLVELITQKHGNILTYNDLPHIITPLEKKISSHMSPRPCLNLVLYFPDCNNPIYIHNKLQKPIESNAFLSPRWGGISIINPDKNSCELKKFKPDLKPILSTFLMQLKELLGLKGSEQKDIEHLKGVKAREMIDSTRRTLKSLAQLLSEISSIVISDEVAMKIKVALDFANKGDEFMRRGETDEALKAAQVAFKNSEEAFSDPSLLALLYFPDDQKYAVYIPLFLPIMIPVFMSLTTVRKWYLKVKANQVKPKLD